MAKHCSNSEEVAAFLAQHPQRGLVRRHMPNGYGALMPFVVDGGLDGAAKVIEACPPL